MNRLIIIGASGHGKVVADIAKLNGYKDIVFLDDDTSKTECFGLPVIGTVSKLNDLDGDIFVAVGNSQIREKIMNSYSDRNYPVLIHPSAVVAQNIKIGEGAVIMAGAIINPDVIIGKGAIINTSSSIDHDCVLEDFVHVAVGAHLCGTVNVGNNTWIGAGATVSNNINICAEVTVGAGAVVIRDIEEKGTYVGIPAKNIKK